MKRNYHLHGVGVLYLCLCASVFFMAGCDRTQGIVQDGIEEQLKEIMAADAPEERYTRLLELCLAGRRNLALVVNAGRTALELGRLQEAQLWLDMARTYSVDQEASDQAAGGGDAVVRDGGAEALMWLLSARCAFERQNYRRCISFSDQAARCMALQNDAASGDRLLQVRLLEARSRLTGGLEPLEGCKIIAELAGSAPNVLADQDILQAAEVVVHSMREDRVSGYGEAAAESPDSRLELARTLLRLYCSSRPFSAAHAGFATELCRHCGMDTEFHIGNLEIGLFSSACEAGGGVDVAAAAGGDGGVKEIRNVVKLITEEQWSEASLSAQRLGKSEAELLQHRFLRYLRALARLYCEAGSKSAREEYTRLARLYGREQLYFVHLHRALGRIAAVSLDERAAKGPTESSASAVRLLYREALQGCVAAGPYSAAGSEARAALAVLEGIPAAYHARPLLEPEMRRIAGIVQGGGPPKLLQPLVEALDWPQNRFTLEAGLILRRLRGRPAVRRFLAAELQSAEQRKRERLRAILQL